MSAADAKGSEADKPGKRARRRRSAAAASGAEVAPEPEAPQNDTAADVAPEAGGEGPIAPATDQIEVLDLTQDAQVPAAIYVPEQSDYDPTEDREKIRGRIAQILIWLLVGIVAFALLFLLMRTAKGNLDALVRVLEIVLGPVIGLVGAVTGFYFGARSGRQSPGGGQGGGK